MAGVVKTDYVPDAINLLKNIDPGRILLYPPDLA
jgi:hypothetical protein